MAQSVLFVCTGNICRSPMAEALFKGRLAQHAAGQKSWLVGSAGTWALTGEPASENAVKAMARRGLNLANHRARQVTADLLEDYNLILVMESTHKSWIRMELPAWGNRVHLLSEMVGMHRPVDDPYGMPLGEYEATAREINNYLEKGWERILELAAQE